MSIKKNIGENGGIYDMWLTWNVEVLFSFSSNVALFKRLGFLVDTLPLLAGCVLFIS